MARTIDFNIPKKDRKKLVEALAEYFQTDPVYCGAPTFAYKIGAMTVDKDGLLTIPTIEDEDYEVSCLLEILTGKGYVAAIIYNDSDEVEETDEEDIAVLESKPLNIRLPAEGFTDTAKDNLLRILSAKGELIKKALGIKSLDVIFTENEVVFPWFKCSITIGEKQAYTHFITALAGMAKSLKRSTSKEKEPDNEKYAFRCFLLRLGFIGAEYKAERKILLRNLSGSSAFKTPKVQEETEVPA